MTRSASSRPGRNHRPDGMPADIYDKLWRGFFNPVAGQVAKADKVLDSYAEVVQLSTEAGLGTPDGVGKIWGKGKISETLVVVEEQRQAINAILSATRELGGAAADSVAVQRLAEAREKYAAGDFAGAKSARRVGSPPHSTKSLLVKMIEKSQGKKEGFSPNFFGRIGMFFTNPEVDLAKAEPALADGDGTKRSNSPKAPTKPGMAPLSAAFSGCDGRRRNVCLTSSYGSCCAVFRMARGLPRSVPAGALPRRAGRASLELARLGKLAVGD